MERAERYGPQLYVRLRVTLSAEIRLTAKSKIASVFYNKYYYSK